MGRIPTIVLGLSITAAAWAQDAAAPDPGRPTSQTWELRGRDWMQIPSADPNLPADPQLDRIEQLIGRGNGKAAFKEAVQWLKNSPLSTPQRDRALFLAARGLDQSGESIKAFYYLDELLDTFPESPYYQPALEFQYTMADRYLNSPTRRFLGLPVGDYTDEATEMLFRIQQRSPGSQLAERALLRTADHYYAAGDYDLAGDAYAAFARSYPRSPEYSRVRLQQAYSYLAQFRDAKFDATPVIDARTQLAELMSTNPELAAEQNIPALIDRIDSTLAQKLNVTAQYYRRVNKPQSAAFLYAQVVEKYPNSPEADIARGELQGLPSPPAAIEPTTQPAASAAPRIPIARAR